MAENSAPVYAEGVPCRVDAQLPDVEAGRRFYGELFGWTFETAYGPSVRALRDGEPVAVLTPKTDGRMPTVWTVYFATPDAAALTGRIRAAGGLIVTEPQPVGDLGTLALAADPEGAVFGLWQPGSRAGFGVRHEEGTFVWAELYTRDTEAADRFYGGLFHDALFGPDARPDFGRAPVDEVFPAEMPPHFLVHFRVADCAAAAASVVRLGGRVQAPPFDASYGRVAVVTDNQGASFALLERAPDGPRGTGRRAETDGPAGRPAPARPRAAWPPVPGRPAPREVRGAPGGGNGPRPPGSPETPDAPGAPDTADAPEAPDRSGGRPPRRGLLGRRAARRANGPGAAPGGGSGGGPGGPEDGPDDAAGGGRGGGPRAGGPASG